MKEMQFPGHLLREEREARGLRLDEVRRHINVPESCLAAFEDGRLADLPVKAYAVGFLQSYCRFLELDHEPLTAQYHACHVRLTRGGRAFSRISRHPAAPARPAPRWVSEALTWGTVCAVLLLGWFAYSIVIKPMAETWRGRAEAGTVEIAPPSHFDEVR